MRMRVLGGFALPVLTVIAAVSGAPGSARALDDGAQGIFETLKGLATATIGFGMGSGDEDEKPRIQYRERAPLVLPPKNELPPPGAPAAARNPNWPQDYDETRRQRANAARNRNQQTDSIGTYRMSNEELAAGRSPARGRDVRDEQCGAGGTDAMGVICDPSRYWTTMRNARKQDDTTRDLTAGAEPARKALTDPPTGYRRATKSVKYVPEAPREEVSLNDPRAQMLEDERRARERAQ